MSAKELIAGAIERALAGEDLGRDGSQAALAAILAGEVDPVQTGALLVALRAKGETAAEIAGLAEAVRAAASRVSTSRDGLIDTCGTGGGASTFNISTTVALVVAGAGVPVAKHGNRSVTSRSGSADVLEALGVRVDLTPDEVGRSIDEVGIGFMFAPAHHPAFRHVGPVRQALGVRTIFNLLGPCTNPAGARRQMIGVFDARYLDRLGEALATLGAERALVVSGRDGIDEVSTGAPTDAVEVSADGIRRLVIDPAEHGIAPPPHGALAGGDAAENAEVVRRVVAGEHGPARDVVALNAACALWLAGRAESVDDGLRVAAATIDSGAAERLLEAFAETTHRLHAERDA